MEAIEVVGQLVLVSTNEQYGKILIEAAKGKRFVIRLFLI